MGLWNWGRERLSAGLAKSRGGILGRLSDLLSGERKIDAAALESIEETLIAADCGPDAAQEIARAVGDAARRGEGAPDLRALLARELLARLPPGRDLAWASSGPTVVLVVGVNGTGKTTTVAKLARRYHASGKKVIVAAADTFRAAAVEQLAVWCERVGVPCLKHAGGGDPAAVVFDAGAAALARGLDLLLVDTAGRLQAHAHLMRELGKIARVAGKAVPGGPHEVLLVLDANAGQNALVQAREFGKAANLTGVILAKMDGTAKGGIAVAIHQELGLPVLFVGTGETVEDLAPFDREAYVEGLLGA